MKLSICMIVKNEEANLQRCLDSLLPIIHMKDDETLENLTELIIVDTGSTDRTLNVAKKFTDKVFVKEFVPWDFSAARNFGIEKATGEYILILDADEELPQQCIYPLMDLALNPAMEYPTIFFWIQNMHSKDGSKFSRVRQPRMFKNNGAFCYEGSVHNKPKCKTPYFFSEIMFKHYGYQFAENKELRDQKTARSLPLLLEDYRKDPKDLHAITHLVKTYRIIADYDNVIFYGEKWIEEIKKVETHEGWFGYWETYADLMEAYLVKKDTDNAFRVLSEAEAVSKRIIDMYLMIWNYYVTRDPEKAREYGERAIEIFQTQESPYEELLTTGADMVVPRVMNYLAIYYYQKGDLMRSGQMMNDGILINENRQPIRWDVYNEVNIFGEAKK